MARSGDSSRLIHKQNGNDSVGTTSPYTITSSYVYDTHYPRFDRGKGQVAVGAAKRELFKGWIPPIQEYDATNINHLKHTHVVTYRVTLVEGWEDFGGTLKPLSLYHLPDENKHSYYKEPTKIITTYTGKEDQKAMAIPSGEFNLNDTATFLINGIKKPMTRIQLANEFMDYVDNNINTLNLGVKFCGARYNRVIIGSTYYKCKKAHIARNNNKPGTPGTSTYQWYNRKYAGDSTDAANLVTEYWDDSNTYWDSFTSSTLPAGDTDDMYETWQWGKTYFPNRNVISYETIAGVTKAINFDITWDGGDLFRYENAEQWAANDYGGGTEEDVIITNGNYYTLTGKPDTGSTGVANGISDPTKHYYITHVQKNNAGDWYVIFRMGANKIKKEGGNAGSYDALNMNVYTVLGGYDFDSFMKDYFEEELFHNLQLGHNNDLNYGKYNYTDIQKFGLEGYTKDDDKLGTYEYLFENKYAPYNKGIMKKFKKKINEDRIITLDTIYNRFNILKDIYQTNVVKICGIVQNTPHYGNGDPLLYEPNNYNNGTSRSWGYNASYMRAYVVGQGAYRALLAYCEVDRTGYFEFVVRVMAKMKPMNLQLFIISKEFFRYMQTKYISQTGVEQTFTLPERDLSTEWAAPNHTYGHFWYYLSDTFTLQSVLDDSKFQQFYTTKSGTGKNTIFVNSSQNAFNSALFIHTDKDGVYGEYRKENGISYQRVGAFKEVHTIEDLETMTGINLIPKTDLF